MKAAPPAAALLLLLAGLPATAQAPTPIDLAVASVTLAGPAPWWVEQSPSGPAVVHTLVHNRGATAVAGYQVSYGWQDAAGQTPLAGTAKPANSIDIVRERLEPGQTRIHAFTWKLQPNQEGAGHVVASVQALGGTGAPAEDARPEDNAGSVAVFVARHALRLEPVGAPLQIHPGETLFARLQVVNPGNVPETVNLSLLPRAGPALR
ncbi:MAG TPA: hypothetical protein VHI93_07110, partial [Candidatus Thermoplasmatota archaeon]|nr:hypothetical protein [Candidatus Thermoplasmatota archaeon]